MQFLKSLGFRAVAKRAAAFSIGLLFTLLLAEAALRLPGAALARKVVGSDRIPMIFGMMDPGPMRPDAFRILCAGNSHTQGAAESVRGAFPAQLEDLLREKYPGRDFQVINMGLGNWNSSEVLENLPAFLSRYQPRVVFAMLGEPNYWNYRFLPGQGGALANALRRLKIVRLLDLLRRFDPKVENESMPSAPDPLPSAPWLEFPQLATAWVAYLDRHPDLSAISPADLEVARSALERWTEHRLGRAKRRALSTLVSVAFQEQRYDEALAAARQLLDLPGGKYDYYLHKVLADTKARWPSGAKGEAFRGLVTELQARDGGRNWLAHLSAPSAGELESAEFLERAIDIAPGDFRFAEALGKLYRKAGHADRILPLYREALAENPGALGLNNRQLDALTPEEKSAALLSGVFPPLIRVADVDGGSFGEGRATAVPGLARPGELESEMDRVRGWVEVDLRRTVRLVADFGAQLVLQTYPLYRKSLRERWPDPLIREAAGAAGVPLSDTSRVFASLFREHPSEEYYFKKDRPVQDDHLNTKGNRIVAEQMLEKLEEMGVLR